MPTTVGIKFLYQFSVGAFDLSNPGSNVISVTNTAAGDHDKQNLTTQPLRETWRSADVSTQYIVIQANDTTVTPDVFALLYHNLSPTAIVIIQANNSNSWGAPAWSGTMVWNAKHMVYVGAPTGAYNYYRFKIIDPGNPCGYIEIGRIVAGPSFTMTNNEDIDDVISGNTTDLAYTMDTEGFFRAYNERVKTQEIEITFPSLQTRSPDNTNYQGLLAMFNYVGITQPFLTIVDPIDPYFKLIWGQFDGVPSDSYDVNRFATIDAKITEVY